MLPFSKDRLNHDDAVIIQLVSGSGEAQDLKLVNYVFASATSEIQSGRVTLGTPFTFIVFK